MRGERGGEFVVADGEDGVFKRGNAFQAVSQGRQLNYKVPFDDSDRREGVEI